MPVELLTLNIENLPIKQEMFAEMVERVQDLSPVWEYMHIAFMREMEQQFVTEGAHINGTKWAPLSPAYAKRKPTPPPPYGILYRTGRLLRSLTKEVEGDHIKIVRPQSAMFGSSVPYGRYHQTGTEIMPQRKFIGVRATFRTLLHRATTLYLLKGELPVPTEEGV